MGYTGGPSGSQHSTVGFRARKAAKETEESHFFTEKKKKSLKMEAQEQTTEGLHFLRLFTGHILQGRNSQHTHTLLI